jgi:hypothetical protein
MKPEMPPDQAYDVAMHGKGFVICIFPAAMDRVCYSYTPLQRAGPRIGTKRYADGSAMPIHAVKHREGDSLEALGRLKRRHQPHFQEREL